RARPHPSGYPRPGLVRLRPQKRPAGAVGAGHEGRGARPACVTGCRSFLARSASPEYTNDGTAAALAGWSAGDPGSAGTFGFVAAGSTDGKTSVLSNAHMPALASTGSLLRAGIAIRQPGGYD